MKKSSIAFLLASFALGGLHAEDAPSPVKKMKAPKHVVLTPEQQKELDNANEALEKGYRLLIDGHKPDDAVAELRKAFEISQHLATLKGSEPLMAGVAEGNSAGTPFDKIDTTGGMEQIAEIGNAAGYGAAPDVDNGLYKRKLIKAAEEAAKQIDAEQKTVTIEIQGMAGAAAAPKKPEKPTTPGEEANMRKIVVDGTTGAQQAQATPPPTPANPGNPNPDKNQKPDQKPDQKNGGGAADPNAPNDPNAKQDPNAPKNPNAKQDPAAAQANAGNPQGKPDANDPKQANTGKPDANNGDPKQANAGKPDAGKPDAANPGAPNEAANADQQGKADPAGKNAPSTAQNVAAKEEAIARALNDLANQYAQVKGADAGKLAKEFRQAAAAADRVAELVKNNEMSQAAAASADAERRINDALKDAGMAGTGSMEEALNTLKKKVDKLQDQQQKILAQAREAGKDASGAAVPDSVKKDREKALMVDQAKLKPQIEELQTTMKDLAQAGGNGEAQNNANAHTAENAAREELGKAEKDLARGKTKQAAVDATMKLGEGDTEGAATAMAKVQNTLNAVQQRLDAADNALAGGDDHRLERDFNSLKELAAGLRRIEKNAKAAAGNGKPEQAQNGAQGDPSDQSQNQKASNQGNPTPGGRDAKPPKPDPKQNGQNGEGGQNADAKDPAGKPDGKEPGKDDGKTADGKKGDGKADPKNPTNPNGGEPDKTALNGEKGEKNDKGEKGEKGEKGDGGDKNDPGKDSHGEVSASWGQVLNTSNKQINAELLKLSGRLAKNDAATAKLMEDLAKKDPAFERDFDRSIAQVQSMLSAVEKMEAGISQKIEKEKEAKAMKNFRKDEVPGAYKPAVAAYYEELSKSENSK